MDAIRGMYNVCVCVCVCAMCEMHRCRPIMSPLLTSNITACVSFGYVVEGSDLLADIKEGDTIVSAKVTDGLNLLKQPREK
jgi:cyclophilin family peptidyl-prolyl cis-trans isomerase